MAWSNGAQSGLKTMTNLGVTAAAILIGSTEGFVLGLSYQVVDKTVGWENAMKLGASYQNQQRALGLPTRPYCRKLLWNHSDIYIIKLIDCWLVQKSIPILRTMQSIFY